MATKKVKAAKWIDKTEKDERIRKKGRKEQEIEKEDGDIYEKEEVEKELEDDEISSGEAGFMEGYEDTEEGVCSTCGKDIDPEKVIEKEVNDKLFTFCSKKCADIFDKRKAGLR